MSHFFPQARKWIGALRQRNSFDASICIDWPRASVMISAQTRVSRSLEAMAAITVVAAGVFWLGVLSTPKVTEAGQPNILSQVRMP